MVTSQNSFLKITILLFFILVFSFTIRLYGIKFGLPFGDYADEAGIPMTAVRILTDGDLNPHYFNYPPLTAYSIAAITGAINWLIKLIPIESLDKINLSTLAILIGRILSAIYGTGIVLLIFLISINLYSFETAIIASFFIAIQPALVLHSHLATVDMGLIFWILLVSYLLVIYTKSLNNIHLALAGLGTGLATAVKYNAAFLLLPISLTIFYFIAIKKKQVKKSIIYILLVAIFSIIIFIIVAPFTLLDFASFKSGLEWEIHHQKVGHYSVFNLTPTNIPPLLWGLKQHLITIWYKLGLLVILPSLGGLLLTIKKSSSAKLSFFSIPFFYFLIMIFSKNAPERYTMVIYPFIGILAASFIEKVSSLTKFKVVSLLVLGITLIIPSSSQTYELLNILEKPQTVQLVRQWFFKNVPPKCGIASDIYSGVWINASQGNQLKLSSLSRRTPEWYEKNKIHFLVRSSTIYQRDIVRAQQQLWRRKFYFWLERHCFLLKHFSGRKYDLFNPEIDVFLLRKELYSSQKSINQNVKIKVLLGSKPARRFSLLWNGSLVYNGNERVFTVLLPIFPLKQTDLGVLYFKNSQFIQIPDYDIRLTFQPSAFKNTNKHIVITPNKGKIGANNPFLFVFRESQNETKR